MSSGGVVVIWICLLCLGQTSEICVGKQYPIQGNKAEWLSQLLLMLLQKRWVQLLSPGLAALWGVCHTGSIILPFHLVYICLSKYYFVIFIAGTCNLAQNSKCQKRVTKSTSFFLWCVCLMAPPCNCLKGEMWNSGVIFVRAVKDLFFFILGILSR